MESWENGIMKVARMIPSMELWNYGIAEVGKDLHDHQVQALRIMELWNQNHGMIALWNYGFTELWGHGIMGPWNH